MSAVRIAVVLPDIHIRRWQQLALDKIAATECVDVCAVYVLPRGREGRDECRAFERLPFLLRILLIVDRTLFGRRKAARALEFGPAELPAGWPELAFVTDEKVVSKNGALAEFGVAIKSLNLDVVVDLALDLNNDIGRFARCGIWRLLHHPTLDSDKLTPGFFESLDNEPTTGTRLVSILGANRREVQICASSSTTYVLSPSVNRGNAAWSSSVFIARELLRLSQIGSDRFFDIAKRRNRTLVFDSNDYRNRCNFPKNVRRWIQYAWRIVRRAVIDRLYWEQWYLLYNLNGAGAEDIAAYKELIPPNNEFWADPHILIRDESVFVFLEVYPKSSKKGHISCVQIDAQGTVSEPVKVLETDYHLSYPMIVEESGNLYMIPETKQNGTIDLYRCRQFPHQWEFVKTLFDNVQATDATPFFHDGLWWLFVTMVESDEIQCREELFLFFTDDLINGKWTPHPLNPVVSDAASARPAGRIFWDADRVIRPSQDCSFRYGFGLVFNEIVVLTTEDYRELRITTVTPTWKPNVLGVHSFASSGAVTVMDAIRLAPRR